MFSRNSKSVIIYSWTLIAMTVWLLFLCVSSYGQSPLPKEVPKVGIKKPTLPKVQKPVVKKPTISASELGIKPDTTKKSFFRSTGTAQVSTQHSSFQGNNEQVAPPDHLRLMFNTTLTVGIVPVQMQGFFTTEQSPLRQNMNYFTVNVNYEELQNNIRRKIKEKYERLKKQGLENIDSLYQKQKDSLVKNEYEKQYKSLSLPDRNKIAEEYKAKMQKKAEEKMNRYRDSLGKEEKTKAKLQSKADSARRKWEHFNPDTDTLDATKQKALDRKQALEDSLARYEQKTERLKQQYQKYAGMYEQYKNVRLNEDSLKRLIWEKYGKATEERIRRKADSLEQKLREKHEKYEKLKALGKLKQGVLGTKARELDTLGLVSKWEKVLLNFKTVNIGTSFPYYSDYMLNRVPVTGLNIEYAPKHFYLSATGSKNLKAVNGTASTSLLNSGQALLRSSYARDLLAAAVGVGRQDQNHVHLNVMYGLDHSESMHPDSVTAQTLRPRENWVLGTDFSYVLPKKVLPIALKGELNTSLLSKDVSRLRLKGGELGSWLPEPVRETDEKVSDVAFRGSASWQADSLSLLQGDYQRVGTGYYSLGVPFLRNDFQQFRGEVRRQFLRKRLSISVFGSDDRTNLSGRKSVGLHTISGGGGLGLHFPKLPVFMVRYLRSAGHQQERLKDGRDTSFVLTTLDNGMVTITHGFQTGAVRHQTALSGTGQWVASPNPIMGMKVYNVQYVHSVMLKIPMVLSATGGFVSERRMLFSYDLWNIGVQGSYVWRGFTAVLSGGMNLHSVSGSKYMSSLQLRKSVGKHFDLTARGEYQYFSLSGHAFSNTIVSSGITAKW